MNYGGITFRIYLIPSYLVFSVFIGCGLGALRRWLTGLVHGWPRWLAWPLVGGLVVATLLMPLYPLWQNWAKVDESENTYFRDMASSFVEHVEPDFVLVEAESRYDDLEAILYMAWAERGWYIAQTVTPGEIDVWLGQRPIYCWYGDVDIHPRYVQEPAPDLPGMARIVGVHTE
jgi:hypothetical protein